MCLKKDVKLLLKKLKKLQAISMIHDRTIKFICLKHYRICLIIIESRNEKTCFLHMRKQKRRSVDPILLLAFMIVSYFDFSI